MKILEVVEASGGGVGRHVRGLCQDLILQGQQLTVAYSARRADEPFNQFLVDQHNEIRFVPLEIGREISPREDVRATFQLMRYIKEEDPFDIVHGHSAKGGAIARIAGRRFNIPTVYTPHGLIMSSPETSRPRAAIYTSIEYVLGQWATSRIIAVSEGEREFILELGLIPANRIVLIHNGLDDEYI